MRFNDKFKCLHGNVRIKSSIFNIITNNFELCRPPFWESFLQPMLDKCHHLAWPCVTPGLVSVGSK